MKKSLIIIFLGITALVGKANAQSPTLDETIDWLNGKISPLVNSGYITINRTAFHNPMLLRSESYNMFLIDLQNVRSINAEQASGYFPSITFSGAFVESEYERGESDGFYIRPEEYLLLNPIKRTNVNIVTVYFHVKNKEELTPIVKAFEHLAKLRGAKLINGDLFKN